MKTSNSARILFVLPAFSFFLMGCEAEQPATETVAERRPNILLILVDDMGYTDIGAFGSEVRTPNIDQLAMDGVRLTNFHASPQCAPTRSMLMSGSDNHKAGMGSMFGSSYMEGEIGERWGYEQQLFSRVATLPERLGDAGYHTYMAGKWHLGRAPELWPTAKGFDRAFALTHGASSHMEIKHLQVTPTYQEDGEMIDSLPDDFYSTNNYTDKIIEHMSSNAGDGKPFFAYLALTAPHWPLQVPEEYRGRYAGVYDEGFDVLRSKRVSRAEELGMIPVIDRDQFEPVGDAWAELSEEEQRFQSRAMEIYAAMLENMDDNIGRVVSYLEEAGELENTFIFFMSDNGAEADDSRMKPGLKNLLTPDSYFRADYETLGTKRSWAFIGDGWAQASTAPYSRFKGFLAEGGTRAASFAFYPAKIAARSKTDQYLNVTDVMPTLLEIAGAEFDPTTVRGREVVPMDGMSFVAALDGRDERIHPTDVPIAFELHGQRALRLAEWKIVWEQAPMNIWWDDEPAEHWNSWRLFNLENDPTELHDLSATEPQKLTEMVALWDQWAEQNHVLTEINPIWPTAPRTD
jgi:arylsulfatase A-like enzyme